MAMTVTAARAGSPRAQPRSAGMAEPARRPGRAQVARVGPRRAALWTAVAEGLAGCTARAATTSSTADREMTATVDLAAARPDQTRSAGLAGTQAWATVARVAPPLPD